MDILYKYTIQKSGTELLFEEDKSIDTISIYHEKKLTEAYFKRMVLETYYSGHSGGIYETPELISKILCDTHSFYDEFTTYYLVEKEKVFDKIEDTEIKVDLFHIRS